MIRWIRSTTFALGLGAAAVAPPAVVGQGSFTIQAANRYLAAKDWNGLLQYSTAWTRGQPKEAMAWFYLGSTYDIGLNDPGHAAPAFETAVALKPAWPEAWTALGHVYLHQQRNDDAIKAFTQAVKLAPKRPNYWNNLASAYSFENRLSKTVDALEAEQQAAGSSMGFLDWYNLGNGFLAVQQDKSAASAYRQALKLNPNYAAAWNNLGTLEGMLGNTAAALDDYRRASGLGDPLGDTNFNRLQNAITAAREAQRDDPLKAFWRGQAIELERRAQLAWQERLAAAQTPD